MRRYGSCAGMALLLLLAGPTLRASAQEPGELKPVQVPAEPPDAAGAVGTPGATCVVLEIECGDEAWGRIVIEIFEAEVPLTARSFLRYVDEGYYDGTIFHRVLPTFLIQGGGHTPDGRAKRTGQHGPIRNEARTSPKNTRYTVAMARQRSPHSATTQFFINLADNEKLDYPNPDGYGYCVFGKVVSGQNVIERIARVGEKKSQPQLKWEQSWPVQPPVIRRAHRLEPVAATHPVVVTPPQDGAEVSKDGQEGQEPDEGDQPEQQTPDPDPVPE